MGAPAGAAKKMSIGQWIGFAAGIVVLLILWFAPITPGLADNGRKYLAILLCCVIWWATKPIAPPYTALFLMSMTLAFNLAPIGTVSAFGATSNFFVYFAAFIFVDVIEKTGLAKRVAYLMSLTLIKGFRSMIIASFIMTLIIGFLIPHPFPRCFLILAIMKGIAQASGMNERDSTTIGFSVFAASIPMSMVTLTADAGLNSGVSALANTNPNIAGAGPITYADWIIRMFLPGIVVAIIFIALFMLFFKQTGEKGAIDSTHARAELNALGKMGSAEIKALVWTLIAVVLWLTQPWTGIPTEITAICVICCMAFPIIGGIAKPPNLLAVEFGGLMYILAAFGIGRTATTVGLDIWLKNTVLPSTVPSNPYVLFLLICLEIVILHFFLGSCVSTVNIMVPVFIAWIAGHIMPNGMALDPKCIALAAYSAVYCQWLFPYQSMNLIIGVDKAPIVQGDVFKIGLPMTVLVFGVLLFEAWFWHVTGLLYVAPL